MALVHGWGPGEDEKRTEEREVCSSSSLSTSSLHLQAQQLPHSPSMVASCALYLGLESQIQLSLQLLLSKCKVTNVQTLYLLSLKIQT